MDYKATAKAIVDGVGGKDNINYMEHCSTRLRFTLKDDAKADVKMLEAIPGVIGIRQNVQMQVIIGNEVNEVYAEVQNVVGNNQNLSNEIKTQKQGWGTIFLDFLVGVFQPLVPAIAGGGVLKSILLLISMFGLIDKASSTYQIINFIGDAPLYFLPILVTLTTARKLNVNQLVAVSATGALILPGITTMISEGTSLLSFNVQNIAYTYQVFPAILLVLFYSVVEKFFTKYTPKAIRIFFVPMMSMVITVPVTLLLLGPIGYQAGEVLSSFILFIFEKIGWLATGLLAAILPFMVATGMHKAMLPYAVSTMTALGKELLYLPASLAHNIAESGACFGVAVRSKDDNKRSTAISAGISALFGITEPALYGVTLQNRRVLGSVVLGSLVGGLFIGIMAVEAFALVGPGIASITMFTNPEQPMNLVWAIVTLCLSFIVTFVTVLVIYKEEQPNIKAKDLKVENVPSLLKHLDEVDLVSPIVGKVMPLAEVKDDVFSSGLLGEGIAFQPDKGVLYAPSAGIVKMIFNTKHALGMLTEGGVELLFHIGINTVELKGEFFSALVKEDEIVTKGQALIEFDLTAIKTKGYDTTVVMVIQNASGYQINFSDVKKTITEKDIVLSLEKR